MGQDARERSQLRADATSTKVMARYKLPAIYFERLFATAGGLIAYGPDPIDPHRRAAAYVDRILKGEKPADLPVAGTD